MLALELEQALHQLEQSTGTLLATETSNLAALCRALDDRADAITRLALVSGAIEQAGPSAVNRLTNVLVQGEEATRRLLTARREANQEWSRLVQMSRSNRNEDVSTIECEG